MVVVGAGPAFLMKHALIIVAFAAILMSLAWKATSDSPYGYDEADYMYAAKFGLVANHTDTPTMPLNEFLRTGLRRGRDSSQSAQLSELIRGSNDVLFYRHWHGPLYFYWLIVVSHLDLDERGMRLFTLAFPICSLLIIYTGCIWIFGETQGTVSSILASALFVWSMPAVRSAELAPHQAFVCSFLACLVLLSKFVATRNRWYLYGAVFAAALSCCLLEVGCVTVATVMVCAYMERPSLRSPSNWLIPSLLGFVGTVIVVWSGAIVKLSFVKSYLFMVYLALFRKDPWGPEGFIETWTRRLLSSPVEWLVIVVGLLIWIFLRRFESDRRLMYPFVVFGALMLLATARVTSGTPRYALLFQPCLDVLAGCMLAAFLVRLARPAIPFTLAILSFLLFAEMWLNIKRYPVLPDTRLSSLLSYIRENHLENSRMLVPQSDLPTLHYYFTNLHLRGYNDRIPEVSTFRDKKTEGVIYPGLPIRYEAPIVREF